MQPSLVSELSCRRRSGLQPVVYGMAQCRNYMSQSDCLACYDAAVSAIRNCSNANVTEARLFSNDCSLRYAGFDFYKDSTDNGVECSNFTSRSVADLSKFVAAGERLVGDLARATPKTGDYYAASRRGLGSAENTTIYGMAHCVQTITQEHCKQYRSSEETEHKLQQSQGRFRE